MRWLVAIVALICAFVLPAKAQTGVRFATFTEQVDTGPIEVTVWLPPGYDRSPSQRYPVLYMHDGQNVFFPNRSGFNKVWAADKAALQLIRARKVAPFIIVAVDHPGATRYLRYFPTRVVNDQQRRGIEGFAKGQLDGDDYLAFLVDRVKIRVDRDYRTRPGPRYTAIAGSSMGGLISLYALGERPDVFGRAAAVSMHWPLIDPKLAEGLRPQILAQWREWIGGRLGSPRGRKLWMDHGTATLDASYRPFSAPAETMLADAGWRRGVEFESRIYEGAEHEENAWRARLPEIMGWLLADWKR